MYNVKIQKLFLEIEEGLQILENSVSADYKKNVLLEKINSEKRIFQKITNTDQQLHSLEKILFQ